MKVILRTSILSGPDSARVPGLFEHALDQRHDVLVDANARTAWEQWLNRFDSAFAEVYRRAEEDSQKRQALFPSDITVIVDVGPPSWTDPWTLPIDEALQLLRTPLKIGVEDITSDGVFLDTVIPPSLRSRWTALHANDAIQLVNVGGVTHIPRRVRTLCQEALRHRLRTLYVIDSDATEPWNSIENLSPTTIKAVRSAEAAGVHIQILQRRMAENYLPPSALEHWANSLSPNKQKDLSGHISAFSNLSPLRRRHHHLKSGMRPAEEHLYANEELSKDDFEALRTKLGPETFKAFAHAEEGDLRRDGVHAELESLFQLILKRA